jgi:predicted RNA-binding Zn-ribbon protein involved in translation (DUF1610 family)
MSSRNNQERFGGPLSPDGDVPAPEILQQTEATQPTMSYIAPTEMVDLPSKGAFYPEGHPLYNTTALEIRHMTAKDEDILVNQSYIKKGIVIDRLLESVIVNKNIKVADLLVGDKNAVIIATRITGYGEEYLTKIACPSCGAISENEFDLSEAAKVTTPDLDTHNATQTENGTFLLALPKSGVTVEVRPLTGADEKSLINSEATRKKHKLAPIGLTDHMKNYVISASNQGSPVNPHEFIDNMPALDSRYLRSTYRDLMPNVELVQHYECNDCGYEQDLEVPFTSDFFWPK